MKKFLQSTIFALLILMTLPTEYYDILGDVARLGFARQQYGDCFDD